jgi:hypothetical protein
MCDWIICVQYRSNRKREAERKRSLKMVLNFDFFITCRYYGAYRMGISAELADNVLYGCIRVVGVNRRKEGYFVLFPARAVALLGIPDLMTELSGFILMKSKLLMKSLRISNCFLNTSPPPPGASMPAEPFS